MNRTKNKDEKKGIFVNIIMTQLGHVQYHIEEGAMRLAIHDEFGGVSSIRTLATVPVKIY